MSLSEDESSVLAGLATDEERQTYAMSLPASQAALRCLAKRAGISQAPELPQLLPAQEVLPNCNAERQQSGKPKGR